MGSYLIDVEMETSHKLGWMGRGQGLVRLGHRAAPGDDGLCCVCRRFGTKCAGCAQGISPSDLVRKARSKVFHLNCFTCMVCNKQLSTGEELYVIDENKFVCKDDYLSSSSLKEGSLNSGRRPLLLPCPRPECPPAMPSLARSTSPLCVPTQSSPHLLTHQAVLGQGPGWGREQRSESVLQDTGTPASSNSGACPKLPPPPVWNCAIPPPLPPLLNFYLPWEDINWGLEKGEKKEDQRPGGHVYPPVPSPIRPGSPESVPPLYPGNS